LPRNSSQGKIMGDMEVRIIKAHKITDDSTDRWAPETSFMAAIKGGRVLALPARMRAPMPR